MCCTLYQVFIDNNLFHNRYKSYSKYQKKASDTKYMRQTYISGKVEPSLLNNEKVPHFLMELSIQQYNVIKNNSIHVSGVNFITPQTHMQKTEFSNYSNIEIGCNLSHKNITGSLNLNIDRIKKNMVIITMDKSECMTSRSNVEVINSTINDAHFKGSGVVIVMMAKKGGKVDEHHQDKRIQWQRLVIEMCRYCKNNILKSKMVSHHDSKGEIFSFGYQGIFKKIDNSTVGLYANKYRYEEDQQFKIDDIARELLKHVGTEMHVATKRLSKMVVHIDRLILPSIDVAFEMQQTYGDINLHKINGGNSAMWKTNVCVNATTGQFHTENDTSYTVITVPVQDYRKQKEDGNTYEFQFRLNDNTNIVLPMIPELTFLFSGTFVTHRQACNSNTTENSEPFVNLSSYGNERLFTHIRKSFFRNINK